MKDHVQECPVNRTPIYMTNLDHYYNRYECQCEILRACEERVWKIAYVAYGPGLGAGSDEHRQHEIGFLKGYVAALDAAREAVAAVEYRPTNPETMIRSMALDAIDALKEKP